MCLCYKKNISILEGFINIDYAGDKFRERAQVEVVNSLENVLYLGYVRNKIQLLYPSLKQNTCQL